MITKIWLEERKPYWDRLAVLVDRASGSGIRALSHDELREAALLYRQVASDLSTMRQDRTTRSVQTSLNGLLERAHNLIYSERRSGFAPVWQFFRRDYPALFRAMLPYTLVSLALLVGGSLVGAALTLVRPAFMTHLLGPEMLAAIHQHRMWTLSINSMAPAESSRIMTNNLGVTFAAYAMGITAGLGTIYMVGWNGILLGVVAAVCAQHQMSLQLWSFVAPHGSLELPSIVIAGGAGLRLGAGVLFPGMYSRRHSLAVAGAESARLIAGVIPLLVIAGTFEGFFSPSVVVPAGVKFATGAVLFSLLLTWLFGTRSSREHAAASSAAQSKLASLISR
jgi:uncharacterized membrane protein SpoIIM required for sporulation